MTYSLTNDAAIIRRDVDGAVIPADLRNADYRAFLEWQAAGNTPTPAAIDLRGYAAAARYAKEVGGIVVAGVPISTDDRSKLMIVGARVAANSDPNWSTTWIGADGMAYPVTASTMIAISDAVQAHVANCFAAFASAMQAIAAGTATTTAQIDQAFAGV